MDVSTCPTCRAAVPADAPGDLCPSCLVGLALGASDLSLDPLGRSLRDSLSSRLIAGDELGPYRIGRLLGRGGMGEVYEAEHLEHGRRVALKVLNGRIAQAEGCARFWLEGQLAGRLSHPNVVYTFGAEAIEGTPTIAMELLSGDTLRDLVEREGPLEADRAVDAVLQVIDGLEAASAAGILHRDVKPSNCLVDGEGTVKVGDFGLAVPIERAGRRGSDGAASFHGTLAFASPEQRNGDDLDVRSDIYSVGATLFYLLTGEAPPEADSISSPSVRRLADVRAAMRHAPGALVDIVTRCLEPDQRRRVQTYADLHARLSVVRSQARVPAPWLRRLTAAAVDVVLMTPIQALVLATLIGFRVPARSMLALTSTIVVPLVLYWTIAEAVWGETVGQRECGLRATRPNGDRLSLSRAGLRACLRVLPVVVALAVDALWPHAWEAVVPRATIVESAAIVVALTLLWPHRRASQMWTQYDWLAGASVTTAAVVPARQATTPVLAAPEATAMTIGPYAIVESLGTTNSGELFLGIDPPLRRRVWIHVMSPGACVPAHDGTRHPTRLTCVAANLNPGGWAAYEALDGAPLLTAQWSLPLADLIVQLQHLAAELADPARTEAPTLHRVWVTADRRLKYLDFDPPGVVRAETARDEPPLQSAQAVVAELTDRLMAEADRPIPLSVAMAFDRLRNGRFSSVDEVAATLRALPVDEAATAQTRRTSGLLFSVALTLVVTGLLHVPLAAWSAFPGLASSLCALTALGAAIVFRGGGFIRVLDLAVVDARNHRVSRARAAVRVLVAWAWVPAEILASLVGWHLGVRLAGVAAVMGAVVTVATARGLHDRVTFTSVVAR
jgi:hypothetical protein